VADSVCCRRGGSAAHLVHGALALPGAHDRQRCAEAVGPIERNRLAQFGELVLHEQGQGRALVSRALQRRQRAGQLRHLACRAVDRVDIRLQIALVPREQEPALPRLGIKQGHEEVLHGVQQVFSLHGMLVRATIVRPVRGGHAGNQQED
jgi:hypothetical protein